MFFCCKSKEKNKSHMEKRDSPKRGKGEKIAAHGEKMQKEGEVIEAFGDKITTVENHSSF